MPKFKLMPKKSKPGQPDSAKKMYAIPSVVNRINTRELCKVVTRNTSTAPTEAEAIFSLVCDAIPRELQMGNSVQLGSLGWLRLSFGSVGVDDVKDFDAASMIRNVRVVFTPSKELMNSIKTGLSFENVGVIEEGFTFPSIKAYQDYKTTGQLPVTGGGGSTTQPGGEDSDDTGSDGSFG